MNHTQSLSPLNPLLLWIPAPLIVTMDSKHWLYCIRIEIFKSINELQWCGRSPVMVIVRIVRSELMLISGSRFLLLRPRPCTLHFLITIPMLIVKWTNRYFTNRADVWITVQCTNDDRAHFTICQNRSKDDITITIQSIMSPVTGYTISTLSM